MFHFAVPFALLLMRGIKRHADRLFRVCLLMIAIRLVDVYWITEPAFYAQHIRINWMDFVTPLAVGGLWLAVFFWHLKIAGPCCRSGIRVSKGRRGRRWRTNAGIWKDICHIIRLVTRHEMRAFGRLSVLVRPLPL